MEHISRQIPPKAHTAMYNWHKFWGRKTWNVVSEFMDTYCPKGGIVMDPFSGSGVTALESLKLGRRVIAVDLNPIATEILRLTIQPVEPSKLHEAYERVEQSVKKKINDLYLAECKKCKEQIPIECAVWKRDEKKNLTLKELRYKCPNCGEVVEKGGKPTPKDLKHIKEIVEEFQKKKLWYPKNPLYYSDGLPFKEKQKYDSLAELFTPRNLYALAILMDSIEDEKDKTLKDFLKIAFSSMVHLCSTMGAVSDPLPTSHHTSFSSTGWTQHSYWYAREFMEQNVWSKFESAIEGHQGLIKAKIESNKYFKDIKITHNLNTFLKDTSDICIITGSCIDVLDKMPARSVDYIFTDPPYDASIQYGELSYMWAAWLKKDEGYLDKISSEEIVRNERQHKDFDVYHTLLRRSFDGMHKVLKLNKYLTLTFHNPTFKVRNATIRAGTHAGFDFEKIHHQPTAQKSGKSLLQPFGSAMGDFYLRFHKPASVAAKAEAPEEIDEKRFEKIVVDTTVQLLAERAEPTPYTIVINFIDPILAKSGYFSSLHTGLDVKTVLKNHIDQEFKLVEERLGGAKGKLWWFKDPKVVYRLKEIPLSERVEQTILRTLQKKGKVTFTDAWEAVSIEFPNSLTSDSTSIKDALEQYARQVTGGYWLLKPQVNQRVNQHNEIIGVLAETGETLGYKIWIGKKEQSGTGSGVLGTTKLLKSYVNVDLEKVKDLQDISTVEMIDLLWIEGKNVIAAFEIESTTTMTSGLVRGSNLPSGVPKYLVIPEEREEQLKRKMKSPMFAERFENDKWQILYFDTLRNSYKKLKNQNETIQNLVNQKVQSTMVKDAEANYNLFVEQD
ncbi:MAG: DNA adenine methylase [Ignavibacteriales bacterium]|nr:DNA adenine methylase [Ignavibacteriales bacterium]